MIKVTIELDPDWFMKFYTPLEFNKAEPQAYMRGRLGVTRKATVDKGVSIFTHNAYKLVQTVVIPALKIQDAGNFRLKVLMVGRFDEDNTPLGVTIAALNGNEWYHHGGRHELNDVKRRAKMTDICGDIRGSLQEGIMGVTGEQANVDVAIQLFEGSIG